MQLAGSVGIMILWAVLWSAFIAIPIVGLYALWRFVKAYERRGAERSELSVLKDRLLRVEESTGEIHERLDKLAEEQRFLTRLLRERSDAQVDA